MGQSQEREKLVAFLDQRVFDPILRHERDEFSEEAKQRKFDDVKRSTESEKRRYHDEYGSAEDVRKNYLSDLSSEVGKRKSRELEELGLPTLGGVKAEFMSLCAKLGLQS